jgi:hypothetical protein
VIPTTASGSRSSITWAARPHHAATRHSLDLVQLRAFDRVPSNVDVRADAATTHETTLRAAVHMIESAEVGPNQAVCPDLDPVGTTPLRRQLEVTSVIVIAKKRLLAPVAPLRDMVRQARCNNSCQSGHESR